MEKEFDFDAPVSRRGIDSLKWDCGENELPLWVADMDFEVAPAIMEALRRRIDNATFGYSVVPDRFRCSVTEWWKRRHGIEFDPAHVLFAIGVIPALTCAIKSLSNVGERVVLQSPVYNNFYSSILNAGRQVSENRLVYNDGVYCIDFEDLERRFADPRTSLFVLCNPHNPEGAVWSRDDLARIGALAENYRVTVVSDEIHCDVMRPGMRHVPFAAASETCRRISVTLGSPSKAFNVAGLHSAYAIADDPLIRNRMKCALDNEGVSEPNDFAVASTIAAYEEGEPWLDAVCAYVQRNKDYAVAVINAAGCGARALESDSTYLIWIDCRELLAEAGCDSSDAFTRFLRAETGLILSSGDVYGSGGNGFVRMNLGTQRVRVEDGVARFIEGCRAFAEEE